MDTHNAGMGVTVNQTIQEQVVMIRNPLGVGKSGIKKVVLCRAPPNAEDVGVFRPQSNFHRNELDTV